MYTVGSGDDSPSAHTSAPPRAPARYDGARSPTRPGRAPDAAMDHQETDDMRLKDKVSIITGGG
ncbi:MAG TPA: hypothetical protein VLS28_09030, partial [Candidatus Sulfomarinibacteraceae bacterium]|nr:hypothetical protein [Candidatus Sulfomarinibacteraceae bacterium]